MEAVKRGISISGAARQFQVPRKTSDDRVKGQVPAQVLHWMTQVQDQMYPTVAALTHLQA